MISFRRLLLNSKKSNKYLYDITLTLSPGRGYASVDDITPNEYGVNQVKTKTNGSIVSYSGITESQANSLCFYFPSSDKTAESGAFGFAEDRITFSLKEVPESINGATFDVIITAEGLPTLTFVANNIMGDGACSYTIIEESNFSNNMITDEYYTWGDYFSSVNTTKPISIKISKQT